MRRVRLGGALRSTDVLDTWFSSALWPFATLGWPDDTEDLRAFYPGDINTTARDIIRLWENRMIFSGLEMMGDVPFRDVVIHSLVHAPAGGRMSKSLGTGMNPLALIETYGADATRYGLMKMASSQDVRFGRRDRGGPQAREQALERARLILQASEGAAPDERPRTLEEHWILARLSQAQREVERLLGEFDFSHLVDEIQHLTFDDFCDWCTESIKPRLYDGDADARATAVAALERLLKLLHPAMPHVTEESGRRCPSERPGSSSRRGPRRATTRPRRRSKACARLRGSSTAAASGRRASTTSAERIFDAVVRPGQQKVNGNVEAERERLRKEIERAEKQLANERFVANAPPNVVEAEREKLARYRRELDAISD